MLNIFFGLKCKTEFNEILLSSLQFIYFHKSLAILSKFKYKKYFQLTANWHDYLFYFTNKFICALISNTFKIAPISNSIIIFLAQHYLSIPHMSICTLNRHFIAVLLKSELQYFIFCSLGLFLVTLFFAQCLHILSSNCCYAGSK